MTNGRIGKVAEQSGYMRKFPELSKRAGQNTQTISSTEEKNKAIGAFAAGIAILAVLTENS